MDTMKINIIPDTTVKEASKMRFLLFLSLITFALRADTNTNTAEADFLVESCKR